MSIQSRCIGVLLATGLSCSAQAAFEAPDWVAKSNQHSMVIIESLARFSPETAGQFGVAGFDEKIVDLGPNLTERRRQAQAEVSAELKRRLAVEGDVRVKQDLEILLQATVEFSEDSVINEKYLLPYFDVGQMVFGGLRGLLDDQVEAKRRPAALVRLKRYAGLEKGYTPVTELAKQRTLEQFKVAGLIGPYRVELEQNLANTPRYMAGIRELFAKYKIKGADKAMNALAKQLTDYDAWLKAEMLPRARSDHRLPRDLYAHGLKRVGLDIAPEQLIPLAQVAFVEIRNEMQALAPLVAREHGIVAADYRELIKQLKKKQLDPNSIVAFYTQNIEAIEAIIRREKIVALPERPMIMRLASEAESAQQPAPHMDAPRMIGNTGERGEFVLPMANPNAKPGETMDDFIHEGAAWTLSAHEGRPGHELQFTAMIEQGVSLARSLFAFNSVNVEGWALYAEAEMKPYEPLTGQLFALQLRLLRAARAFLDPLLNLGQMTPEAAQAFLEKEVGVSAPFAKQEVDRYTFRSPGQATAYFYGYTQMMQLRAQTELALGAKFERQAFHDFVLAQGLLPPAQLRKAVETEFVALRLVPAAP